MWEFEFYMRGVHVSLRSNVSPRYLAMNEVRLLDTYSIYIYRSLSRVKSELKCSMNRFILVYFNPPFSKLNFHKGETKVILEVKRISIDSLAFTLPRRDHIIVI